MSWKKDCLFVLFWFVFVSSSVDGVNYMRQGMFRSSHDFSRPLDDRIILENYFRSLLRPNQFRPQGDNCTTALVRLLEDERLFANARSQRAALTSSARVLGESSYPFRQSDPLSSQMMKITSDALSVIKENLMERGCAPADLANALRSMPNLETMLSKLIIPKEFCPFHGTHYTCSPGSRFRTLDGSCNNLEFPWFGKAKMPFARFLAPKYDDYIGSPRRNTTTLTSSMMTVPLPSSDVIANYLMFDRRQQDFRLTHLFPVFGMFVFNDLYTTSIRGPEKDLCDCRGTDEHDCIILGQTNGQCFTFPRSTATFVSGDCSFVPREQINSATSWLDLSPIYGNNDEDAERVRSFRNGLLTTSQFAGMEYPSMVDDTQNLCSGFPGPQRKCFDSGDRRINENMAILAIYTLFIREHNRIATKLAKLNPLWKDEELYQEARRINIAQYQHIIAKEFLPVLIGPHVAHNSQLLPLKTGYSPRIGRKTDPSVRNEIASVVGPSMLTMFRGHLSMYSPHLVRIDSVNIRETDSNISRAFNSSTQGIDAFIRGMLVDYANRYDRHFAQAFHGKLDFLDPINNFMDPIKNIPSSAILIGRDHGLPSYNDYRQLCGLSRLTGFNDLSSVMDLETIAILSFLYRDVDNIELFVGAISELPLTHAIVGPTMACLVSNQFKQLKHTDRFHYETNDPVAKFSVSQLNTIRQASMARLICENTNSMPFVQPNAFITSIIDGNARAPCSLFAERPMEAWYDLNQNNYARELAAPELVALSNGLGVVV